MKQDEINAVKKAAEKMRKQESAQGEIIRFAIQCRLVTTGNRDGIYMDALTEFAKLIAAKEREACAKVVDDIEARCIAEDVDDQPLKEVAVAIRARGEA